MAEKALMDVAPVFLVADLARSLAYYRDGLGFDPEFVHGDFYAGVARDGCRIHLKCAAAVRRDQVAFEAAGHVDACFGVVDVAALVGELARRGTVPVVPLREMPYGKEFCVRDPNGYILAFVESLRD